MLTINKSSGSRVGPQTAPIWFTLALILYILLPLSALPFGAHILVWVHTFEPPQIYAFYLSSQLIVLGLSLIGFYLKHQRLGDTIRGQFPIQLGKESQIAVACWLAIVLTSTILTFAFGNLTEPGGLALPKTLGQLLAFLPLAVAAGFCEEIVFRGYLLAEFRARYGNSAAAITTQAILFSLAHGFHQPVAGFVQKLLIGLLFGTIAHRRTNLLSNILAHVGLNVTGGALSALLH